MWITFCWIFAALRHFFQAQCKLEPDAFFRNFFAAGEVILIIITKGNV